MGEIDTAIRQRGDPNFLGGPHSGGSLRKRRFPSEQMGTESSLDAFPFILDPADSNPGVASRIDDLSSRSRLIPTIQSRLLNWATGHPTSQSHRKCRVVNT
ncbi:hypothetical protein PSHT_00545 [Puccinia striiformis]|uniref:Uncharacterized protein n=1 Tax=Puccinia striiformis TaxID=27350 RepID=A0A2S4WMX0_9BASI|nr:hypothetical protein PSHT_00545 [Puccinia striiformis]